MPIDDPRPPAGSLVAAMPTEEYIALHRMWAEVFQLAAHVNVTHGTPETQALRNLAYAINRRLATLPVGVIAMPPAPTEAHTTEGPTA